MTSVKKTDSAFQLFTTTTASFKIQDTTYSHATNNGIVYKLPIVNMIFQLKFSSKLPFRKYVPYLCHFYHKYFIILSVVKNFY